jgi:hypothetical protein
VSFGAGQDGCGELCAANGLDIGQFGIFGMVAKAFHGSSGRPNPSSSASDGMITLQLFEKLRRGDFARRAHISRTRVISPRERPTQ